MTATATQISQVAQTTLEQLGGAHQIHLLTGAILVTREDGVTLVFRRQVGPSKLTHLQVTLDAATDTYTVEAMRISPRAATMVRHLQRLEGIYCDQLKATCEELAGLFFTLR